MGKSDLASGSFQAVTNVVVSNTNFRAIAECRPTLIARKGNPEFGWVVDLLWPDGETEVIKGFATEHETFEWIIQHSKGLQGNRED